jgi:hypothetical protein
MVFAYTDYYITATLPGYENFRSGTIGVNDEIVLYDFSMKAIVIPGPGGGGAGLPAVPKYDLALTMSSDKTVVQEGATLKLALEVLNKSNVLISDFELTLVLPNDVDVIDAAGATQVGNTLTWSDKDLIIAASKAWMVELKTKLLSQSQSTLDLFTEVTSTKALTNLEDDRVALTVKVVSDRFAGVHTRYVKGYPDGSFGPFRNITRAEAAALFARILDLDLSDTIKTYSDLPSSHWAYGYIQAVTKMGLMQGYPEGTFLPENAITRAEFASMIARYYRNNEETTDTLNTYFTDIADSWAKETIEEAFTRGIVIGYEDGSFRPNARIQRTEAVIMINRMLNRGPLTGVPVLFTDVVETDWYFGHVMEASLTHEFVRDLEFIETYIRTIEDELK